MKISQFLGYPNIEQIVLLNSVVVMGTLYKYPVVVPPRYM